MASAPNQKKKEPVLPEAEISETLGLIEILNNKGGRDDIYKLANELSMELGEMLAAIRSAELLKLVHTPGGDVVIEALGQQIVKEKINQRKHIIKEQIEKLDVFKGIVNFLREKEENEAEKEEVLEKLAELMPNMNAEHSFGHLISWGRYAELFGYNDDTNTFYLDNEEEDENDSNSVD